MICGRYDTGIRKGQRAVKDTMQGGEPIATTQRNTSRRPMNRRTTRCSICMHRTWFNAIALREPEGVPEPRREWMLCKRCHEALLVQMRLSPIRTPLRLRIAMGLVAAERSPHAYAPSRRPFKDRTWILIIAWSFVIAMILHLILIVMLASIAGH